VEEGVEFDLDTLDSFVTSTYPDLRKCLNLVQMHSSSGKLVKTATGSGGTTTADYRLASVALFKKGKIQDARKLLCGKARPEEMEDIYRWMYDNLELFGDSDEKKDQALLVIKQGLVDHTLIADAEINLAATLVKLARLQ
jgi:hypothetical protein